MKMKILLLFAIIGIPLAWAALEYDIPNNIFKMGDGGAVNDKQMVFNVGDGATNPSITIDATNKDFTLNKALKVGNALLQLNDGTSQDVEVVIDYGLTVNNPRLIYKSVEDAWFFKNANGVEKRIGSGGGGGKNVFNQLTNPGFEDGISESWTASGLVPTELDSAADVGNELKSARIDCSGAAQYYESNLETFANIVTDGVFCQADFKYKGGDALWDVKIIDAAATELASQTLSAKTDWSNSDSLSFRCDNMDSDQAKIRFECTGDAAQLDIDEVYLGNQTGLTAAVTPDTTATIIFEGTIVSQSSDIIDSISYTGGASQTDVTFKAGSFTQIPSIVGVVDVETFGSRGGRVVQIFDVTTSGFSFVIENTTPAITQGYPVHFTISKQGADAAVSRDIFLNSPKKADNENEFSAYSGDGAGTITTENVDWIDGNCTDNGVGNFTCNFNAGQFSVAPSCQCTADNDAFICGFSNGGQVTTTKAEIRIFNDAGTPSDSEFNLHCSRQESDYKTLEVQPIVIKQVETSVKAGLKTNVCQIDSNGTPTVDDFGNTCSSWIDSLTDIGVGQTRLNLVSGIYNGTDFTCNVSTSHTFLTSVFCGAKKIDTANEVEVGCNDQTGAAADRGFTITCWGTR